MKHLTVLILLLFSVNNLRAQTDEQIINEIFFDLFGFHEWSKDTLLIVEVKEKTILFEDSYSSDYIAGFLIPKNILYEWKKNIEEQIFLSEWNEKSLNNNIEIIGEDTIFVKKPVVKCLSENEMKKILVKNMVMEHPKLIYSLGNIIFDNSGEHAIFSLTRVSDSESASGHTVLIKKVFGKWVIITRFGYWMT